MASCQVCTNRGELTPANKRCDRCWQMICDRHLKDVEQEAKTAAAHKFNVRVCIDCVRPREVPK